LHWPETFAETLTIVTSVNATAFLFLGLSLTTAQVSGSRVLPASRHSSLEIVTTTIDTLARITGRAGFPITGIRKWTMTGIFYFETTTG
jgi:hypothetical protein